MSKYVLEESYLGEESVAEASTGQLSFFLVRSKEVESQWAAQAEFWRAIQVRCDLLELDSNKDIEVHSDHNAQFIMFDDGYCIEIRNIDPAIFATTT